MSNTVTATCHCGAVEMAVTLSNGLETRRRCDCSYCRRRQCAAVTAPMGGITVLRGADSLTEYSFNTHTAKHYFCQTCGIYMYHSRRSNPNEYGVNMYCIKDVDPQDFEPVKWNDGVNHPSDR